MVVTRRTEVFRIATLSRMGQPLSSELSPVARQERVPRMALPLPFFGLNSLTAHRLLTRAAQFERGETAISRFTPLAVPTSSGQSPTRRRACAGVDVATDHGSRRASRPR